MLTITICQASYKSGDQSLLVRNEWFKRAKYVRRVEHCLGFEEDDMTIRTSYGIPYRSQFGLSKDKLSKFITTKPMALASAVKNWNNAASIGTNEFLLLIADDLVPENYWDIKLENFILGSKFTSGIFKFTDDRCTSLLKLPKDTLLPRHPGMFKKDYLQRGFMFDPAFNSTGPDLDLLINSLKNGSLRDAREIKFHHSIGPILNAKSELLCGCNRNLSLNLDHKKTVSQIRMHSKSNNTDELLSNKHSRFEIILAQLSCTNRLSDFVMESMKRDQKNYPIMLIVKGVLKYVLNQFLSPGFRRFFVSDLDR